MSETLLPAPQKIGVYVFNLSQTPPARHRIYVFVLVLTIDKYKKATAINEFTAGNRDV
jgi:hypothetical protein